MKNGKIVSFLIFVTETDKRRWEARKAQGGFFKETGGVIRQTC